MQDFWWVFSVLCSIISAIMILYNQILKLDSTLITIYRGIGVAVILLPFMFFFKPIDSAWFYVLCMLQGLVIGYFDNHIFEASKRYGAGITGLAQPLTLIFTFIIWFIISQDNIINMLNNPIKTSVAFMALICISMCIYSLQNNKLNKKALIYLLPSMLCIVFIDVNGKKIMNLGSLDVMSSIYYYAFFTSLFAGVANLILFIYKKRELKEIITKHNLLVIWLPIAFLVISTNILKMYSVALAFNPAYVGAILYSAPVWIMLINQYVVKNSNLINYSSPNKWVVFFIVVAAIVLVLAS